MSGLAYVARLVPMGKPVTLPDDRGRLTTFVFDQFNFSLSRSVARDIPVLVGHDPDMQIGTLSSLAPNREWWVCDLALDDDLVRTPFEVGQNVSVGLAWHPDYPGQPRIGEVSIVRRGRVPGAEITMRVERGPASSPAAVDEVLHGGGIIRRPGIGQVLAIR